MKKVLALLTIIWACLGCESKSVDARNKVTQTADAGKSLEQAALKNIFARLSKLPNAILRADEIRIGDKSIRLKVAIETEGQQQGKWICAANFQTFYKAGETTQLSTGSIGVGSTKEEAAATCVEEWAAAFGIPFTDMLNGNKPVEVKGLKVFAGPMGIRGDLPKNTWLTGNDAMIKKIILQLSQQLSPQQAELMSVEVKLLVGNSGVVNGECWLNNQVSPALLDNLKTLDWPASQSNFLFKQFYLVRR